MRGIMRFTGGADNYYCDIPADLAIKAINTSGAALIAPRAVEPIMGELGLPEVSRIADILGFRWDSIPGSTYSQQTIQNAGRLLHKVLYKVLSDNPDTPMTQLKITYQFIEDKPVYSQEFIDLRHAIFNNLVSRADPIKEDDLTLDDCVELIYNARAVQRNRPVKGD